MPPKKLNVQNFKRLEAELLKAEDGATGEDYFSLIGVVTTGFELCEHLLVVILRSASKNPEIIRTTFNVINSRGTRNQFLDEYLENIRPKRMTKRFTAIHAAFEEYKSVGIERDWVAHSILSNWHTAGREFLILQPAAHVERKFEGPFPKNYYDLPKLEMLAERIIKLESTLKSIIEMKGEANVKRLLKQHERETSRKPGK